VDDAALEVGCLGLLERLEGAEPAPAGSLSADLVSAFLSEPDFSGPESPSAPLLEPLRLSVR